MLIEVNTNSTQGVEMLVDVITTTELLLLSITPPIEVKTKRITADYYDLTKTVSKHHLDPT